MSADLNLLTENRLSNLKFIPEDISRIIQNLDPNKAHHIKHKVFFRTHLDYGDIFYDTACNNIFREKIESIQYVCLALTEVIWGTLKEKLYQEVGLESLRKQRWYRKLCTFYKIFKNHS